MKRSIGILLTNTDNSDFAKQHDSDGEKYRKLLLSLRPQWSMTVIPVVENTFPENIDDYDAYIITGSPASVHDTYPWIENLYSFIRILNKQQHPTIGICFGHQAIAMALNGEVGPNPTGWSLGLESSELISTQQWMTPKKQSVNLYSAHTEQVIKLPDNAITIATNACCTHAGFIIGKYVMTTQYHPEMSKLFITDLIEHLQPDIPEHVYKNAQQQITQTCDGEKYYAKWMINFIEGLTTNSMQNNKNT